jgi:Zn-dependent protease
MFSNLSLTGIILLFSALVIAIIVHELMHGVVAYWLGDRTAADAGRLTLNPIASIDPVFTIIVPFILIVVAGIPFFAAKPVPFNPHALKWDEYGTALVGIAGPATNFVLAIVGAGLFHITSGGLLNDFALYFTMVNVGIMVFNLIPFPPLDGSRVLYAFAPEPLQRVMEQIENFGFLFLLVFILLIFQFLAPAIIEVQGTILQFLLGRQVY